MSPAQTPVLVANGPQSVSAISDYISYYLDPDWTKTAADMVGQDAGLFEPMETEEPNFGYTDSRVWLRIDMVNATKADTAWRLYVRENFLQYFDVYIVREDGTIELVESHDLSTPFSARTLPYPELVVPLSIAVDERVTLLMSYWSGGSSHAATSLETAGSFASFAITRMSKIYLSYGIMFILIIVSLVALAIFRNVVFSSYFAYVAVTLIYLMHADGVAFQYLWPGLPRLNANFSIIVGLAFVLATYNFARVFLQTKTYHARADRVLLCLAGMTVAIVVPGAFIDSQWTKQALIALILVAIIAGTITGIIAAMTRFRQVRFYLIAWLCGILTAGFMNLRHIFGFDFAQDTEFDSIRISIVVDAIMMGLGVADRYRQVLQSREAAMRDSLQTAEKNLGLSNRLQALEEQYALAAELVQARHETVENTVHDLRQPLHALRLNVQRLKDEGGDSPVAQSDIDETFSYLETLIANHLHGAVRLDKLDVDPVLDNAPPDAAPADLGHVLGSIHDMFLPDAQDKGLSFDYVPTSQTAAVNPLVIMRIVSNLISNAIKYTPQGRVLLGVRRIDGDIRIEVHDTGPGLSAAEFTTAQERHTRLEPDDSGTTGSGIGLAIARELSDQHGLRLYALPGRKGGTSVALHIPR